MSESYDEEWSELEDEAEENDEQPLDVEALVKKARRSRQIDEADVQTILASTDEEQADLLYLRLQKLGIRIVSENGQTVDDVAESSNLLDLDKDESLTADSY